MKNLHLKLQNLQFLLIICAVCAFLALPTSAQENSKEDSKSVTVKQTVLNNCNKALDELEVYDKLLEAKETEIKLLRERFELEKERAALLKEVADARAGQSESLQSANQSLREAIAAKDAQIKNLEREVEILKKKKTSVKTILKAVGIGIGIGLLL